MTNKPMLSVERELIQWLVDSEDLLDFGGRESELRALLDKPVLKSWPCWSCKTHITLAERAEADGECSHCEAELDLDDWPIEPAAQHQGEPVTIQAVAVTRDDEDEGLRLEWLLEGGIAEMEFAGMTLFALPDANDLCHEDGSAEIYLSPQQEKQNAPVAVVLPFAEKIISKLRRFDECASDNQDVDIGRHWFDVLTQLGLLNRVQRSPAHWEMTQQGEDALEATRLNTPQ